jgi:PPM family protein phosphatase
MQFSVYQQSDIGGRKVNQDRMGYCYTREALLLVLADGMGGHLRGEVAATIAMQTMSALFKQQAAPIVKNPARFLEDACMKAHAEILRYAAERDLPDTPRTTLAACLVQHDCAVWAHCGDSRLYWLRRGQVLARTRDHSHIEFLIERGQADPSERSTHPDRNKLYNCLGAGTPPKVEIARHGSLQPGDVLMLCSDGLWSMLPDSEIAHRFAAQSVASAVPDLIAMATAIAGPGSDNTTALAIAWQGAATAAAEGGETVVSTQMLADDEVNTSIAATPEPLSEDVDVFDEDEIEKAIAEIRGAIEKSSKLIK